MRKTSFVIIIALLTIFAIQGSAFGAVFKNENPVKVYNDINFGDSIELVEKKIVLDPNVESGSFNDGLTAKIMLWGLKFNLMFDYINDQLCQITFRGEKQSQTTVKEHEKLIVQFFAEKYGSPSFSREVKIPDIYKRDYVMSHRWGEEKTGKSKEIEIGIHEVPRAKYCVVVTLSYTPLLKNAIGDCKAYRGINFGDSKQLVRKKLAEDLNLHQTYFQGGRTAEVILGENKFYLSFSYDDNRLFKVAFCGQTRATNYLAYFFSTVIKEERDLLVQMISKEYGSPSSFWDVDYSDLNKGYTWSHRWNEDKIGETKEISIGFYKGRYSELVAIMHIDYLPIVKQIEEEEEQKKKEELSNSSDDF